MDNNYKIEKRDFMSVSKKDVEYVADLARISFSEDEKEGLIHDLNKVLGYMEKLNSLVTKDVDIIVNPIYIENKFREDQISASMSEKDVIMNTPNNLEEYILVPKVLE